MFAILRKIIAPKPSFTASGIFESEKGKKQLEDILNGLMHNPKIGTPWNRKKEKHDSEYHWSYKESYSKLYCKQYGQITLQVTFSYGEFRSLETTHSFEDYTFTASDENNAVLGSAANNKRTGTLIKDFYYAVRKKYHQHGLSLTESDEGLLSFADLGKLSL